MAPSNNSSRIVRTWQPLSAPTGETHFEDEHGQTRKTVPCLGEPVTGVDRGVVDWSTGNVRRVP